MIGTDGEKESQGNPRCQPNLMMIMMMIYNFDIYSDTIISTHIFTLNFCGRLPVIFFCFCFFWNLRNRGDIHFKIRYL